MVGVDQSAGMLAQARARGIADRLEQVGLQELSFDAEFDGVMTVDAMENVPPEDWPLVLGNLHRAVRSRGCLYLTVEEVGESDIDAAFADAQARRLPAVRGEITRVPAISLLLSPRVTNSAISRSRRVSDPSIAPPGSTLCPGTAGLRVSPSA